MTADSSVNTFPVDQIRFEDVLWEEGVERSPQQESFSKARFPLWLLPDFLFSK